MENLRFAMLTVGIAGAVFVGMLICVELGRRLGLRQLAKRGEEAHVGKGSVDSAVYGLLSLLIGFTFSSAVARYDARRGLVLDEVGKARTAWQRIGSLPAESQDAVRTQFRRYMDGLIAWHESTPGTAAASRQGAGVMNAEDALWDQSLTACLSPQGERARMLLLPGLNDFFGVVDEERLAQRVHMPMIVFIMLGFAALAAGMFAGYGMASAATRNWIYVIGAAGTIAVAICVIVELESPRLGLVRVGEIDKTLVELRATMGSPSPSPGRTSER
jgi:hypothetical protein